MTDYKNMLCALEKFDKCQKEIIDGCETCPNFYKKKEGEQK